MFTLTLSSHQVSIQRDPGVTVTTHPVRQLPGCPHGWTCWCQQRYQQLKTVVAFTIIGPPVVHLSNLTIYDNSKLHKDYKMTFVGAFYACIERHYFLPCSRLRAAYLCCATVSNWHQILEICRFETLVNEKHSSARWMTNDDRKPQAYICLCNTF